MLHVPGKCIWPCAHKSSVPLWPAPWTGLCQAAHRRDAAEQAVLPLALRCVPWVGRQERPGCEHAAAAPRMALASLPHEPCSVQLCGPCLSPLCPHQRAVFIVTVSVREVTPEGDEVIRVGKLYLVDLAGSENITRCGPAIAGCCCGFGIAQTTLNKAAMSCRPVKPHSAKHLPHNLQLGRCGAARQGGRQHQQVAAHAGGCTCSGLWWVGF